MSTVEERFWSKVEKTDGCWWWRGSRTGRPGQPPYGGFRLTEKVTIRAHRFSWELAFGPVPKGLCVLHRCDNRLCVRPEHLFVGTHADNIRDRDAKGRHTPARGAAQGHAKLTDELVREIRAASGSQREIAARYGVTQSNVSRIRARKMWTHI